MNEVIKELKDNDLNLDKLRSYLDIVNVNNLEEDKLLDLLGLTADGYYTLASNLLFGLHPEHFTENIAINARVVPGTRIGDLGAIGKTFVDNRMIEGNISTMLDFAIEYIHMNIRVKTIIDPVTLMRNDRPEYPLDVIRELLLNALVYRDYNANEPITLTIYDNCIEISNPWGNLDMTNKVIVEVLKTLGVIKDIDSSLECINKTVKEYNLVEPVFSKDEKHFTATLFNKKDK